MHPTHASLTALLACAAFTVQASLAADGAQPPHASLAGRRILFVARHQYAPDHHSTETTFQTGEINAGKFRGGSALRIIDFADGGKVGTLLASQTGVVRDPEVHWDGKRIVFSMRRDKNDDYHIHEINTDGSGFRQLTFGAGVSDIDPVYLPDGSIVFSSTRDYKFCQCNRHIMANLFRMEADGANIRRIGGNDLFEGHAHVMPDGAILYDRWEYVDRHFGPSFGLWTVNPDGTNHALFYGNNAWSPGMIADARIMPGGKRFVATLGSCHDRPWGAVAIIDRTRGMDGPGPIIRSWPADIRAQLDDADVLDPSHRRSSRIDAFRSLPTKYEDPWPLSQRHLLASRTLAGERTALFLLDVEGPEVMVHEEAEMGCFDAMELAPRPRPAMLPDRTDLSQATGRFYVLDVYRGTGMDQVKRGTIRSLRIVEAPPKVEWTHTAWGIDATQAPAMNWNATNNKRIIGTVPVESDGSAYFEAPADTFLYFQALDERGMMVQSMRSGTMVRPGETVGCVGCHDRRQDAAPVSLAPLAMRRPASQPKPWHGPPRLFNYLTEVQPVFNRHCVSCHDFGKPAGDVLNLAGDLGLVFNNSYLELRRKGGLRWEPGGHRTMVKAVDDGPPQVLPPYAWGSHRSILIDSIAKEHHGVRLPAEAFDRLVTWIDLNAPYYGTYASAYPTHPWGRSPLSDQQLKRLRQLTDTDVGSTDAEKRGSQVSFTRPHLSRCLSKLTPQSDAHREAVRLIEGGQGELARQPRADMTGFSPAPPDQARQRKADLFWQTERQVRQALEYGLKVYPFRAESPAGGSGGQP